MNDDQKLKKTFRDELASELRSAEVKSAKKSLISQFSTAPQFAFRPAVLVPAFVCIVGLILFYELRPEPKSDIPIVQTPAVQAPVATPAEVPIPKTKVKAVRKQLEKIIRTEIPSDVKVTRVSSDTGSAMVYQKDYLETPVTVVWVFAKGSSN